VVEGAPQLDAGHSHRTLHHRWESVVPGRPRARRSPNVTVGGAAEAWNPCPTGHGQDRPSNTTPLRSPTVTELRTRCVGPRGRRRSPTRRSPKRPPVRWHVAAATISWPEIHPASWMPRRSSYTALPSPWTRATGRGAGTGSQTGSHSPRSAADPDGLLWRPQRRDLQRCTPADAWKPRPLP
jgi:hypothetical protein